MGLLDKAQQIEKGPTPVTPVTPITPVAVTPVQPVTPVGPQTVTPVTPHQPRAPRAPRQRAAISTDLNLVPGKRRALIGLIVWSPVLLITILFAAFESAIRDVPVIIGILYYFVLLFTMEAIFGTNIGGLIAGYHNVNRRGAKIWWRNLFKALMDLIPVLQIPVQQGQTISNLVTGTVCIKRIRKERAPRAPRVPKQPKAPKTPKSGKPAIDKGAAKKEEAAKED